MMSEIPKDLKKINPRALDQEICRVGMIAELDAINLYEQMAASANDLKIKKILLDIAREEKTHVSEFETLLLSRDAEQVKESKKGQREVNEA